MEMWLVEAAVDVTVRVVLSVVVIELSFSKIIVPKQYTISLRRLSLCKQDGQLLVTNYKTLSYRFSIFGYNFHYLLL